MIYFVLLLIIIGLLIFYFIIRFRYEKKNDIAIAKAGFDLQRGIEVKLYVLLENKHQAKSLPQISGRLFYNSNNLLVVTNKFGLMEMNYFNRLPIQLLLNKKDVRVSPINRKFAKLVALSPRAFKIKTKEKGMFESLGVDYTVRLKKSSESDRINNIFDYSHGLIVESSLFVDKDKRTNALK